jgi:hypothetical protein
VWGGIWGSVYSSACPSTNVRSQNFPKIKTVPSTCRALKLVLHNPSTTQQIVVPSFLHFYFRHNMFRH